MSSAGRGKPKGNKKLQAKSGKNHFSKNGKKDKVEGEERVSYAFILSILNGIGRECPKYTPVIPSGVVSQTDIQKALNNLKELDIELAIIRKLAGIIGVETIEGVEVGCSPSRNRKGKIVKSVVGTIVMVAGKKITKKGTYDGELVHTFTVSQKEFLNKNKLIEFKEDETLVTDGTQNFFDGDFSDEESEDADDSLF